MLSHRRTAKFLSLGISYCREQPASSVQSMPCCSAGRFDANSLWSFDFCFEISLHSSVVNDYLLFFIFSRAGGSRSLSSEGMHTKVHEQNCRISYSLGWAWVYDVGPGPSGIRTVFFCVFLLSPCPHYQSCWRLTYSTFNKENTRNKPPQIP